MKWLFVLWLLCQGIGAFSVSHTLRNKREASMPLTTRKRKNAPVPPDMDPSDLDGIIAARIASSAAVRSGIALVKDAFAQSKEKMQSVETSEKLQRLRERTLTDKVIFPDEMDRTGEGHFCYTKLMDLILKSYKRSQRGDTTVIYSLPSTGKTTCLERLVYNLGLAYKSEKNTTRKPQRLMITAYGGVVPYVEHMASVLGIDDPADVVAYILKALEKTQEDSPASVLILDEMNTPGEKDCNIVFVGSLMRRVRRTGIQVYVATQNQRVADMLCDLNNCEKIGPLEGTTEPTRSEARLGNFIPIVRQLDELRWTKEEILELLMKEFPNFDQESWEWWKEGMTPDFAVETERFRREEEEGSETNLRI